jgi:hypothetical protein
MVSMARLKRFRTETLRRRDSPKASPFREGNPGAFVAMGLDSGILVRIGCPLTSAERYFIVHGIPEGSMSREISLIWEMSVRIIRQ